MNGRDTIGAWVPKLAGALSPHDRAANFIIVALDRSGDAAHPNRTELARYATHEAAARAIAGIPFDPTRPNTQHEIVRIVR